MANPVSILETLSPSQQDLILSWLDQFPIKEVLARIASPPPDGFGINTHATSLRRFKLRRQASERSSLQTEQFECAPEELQRLQRGASAALLESALELAASGDPLKVSAAAKILNAVQGHDFRNRQLLLAQARVDLEREKLSVALRVKEAQSSTDHEEAGIRAAREEFTGASRRAVPVISLPNVESPVGP